MGFLVKAMSWLSSNKAIVGATVGLVEVLVKRTSTKVDDKILKQVKDLLNV